MSLWVVLNGGFTDELLTSIDAQGADHLQCTIASLVSERWRILIPGAPSVVNLGWYEQYPGRLPDGLPLWSRCGD